MVKVSNLTWLSTISSARISLMVHPPPMRNEISLPTIRKQGEMRVPWRGSPRAGFCRPAVSLSLGRYSIPPIHQSPCCCALSLLLTAGLSPNVGWWMKAVPVISHPPIPSSKSKLQAGEKEKEEIFIPQNTLRLSFDIINSLYSSVSTFIAVCSSEPWRTFAAKPFISVSSLTRAIVWTWIAAAGILFKDKMDYPLFCYHPWTFEILKESNHTNTKHMSSNHRTR